MPPKRPVISGKAFAKILESKGFRYAGREGSHMRYVAGHLDVPVVVPDHRELKQGTLSYCMRKAGIRRDELFRRDKRAKKAAK
ncbi:MAG: type II toxin-antitoxin system HicA family toxin [Gammaproteobacteria bacterium]